MAGLMVGWWDGGMMMIEQIYYIRIILTSKKTRRLIARFSTMHSDTKSAVATASLKDSENRSLAGGEMRYGGASSGKRCYEIDRGREKEWELMRRRVQHSRGTNCSRENKRVPWEPLAK